MPYFVPGASISIILYKYLVLLYKYLLSRNQKSSETNFSKELYSKHTNFLDSLKKYEIKEGPSFTPIKSDGVSNPHDLDSETMLILEKLDKIQKKNSKAMLFLKKYCTEKTIEEHFPTPSKTQNVADKFPIEFETENAVSLKNLEKDYPNFDIMWAKIEDGLHTDEHKAIWRINVDNNSNLFFYVKCANYFALRDIPCRKMRTKQLKCVNDIDFKIKLYALRKAFDNISKDISFVIWFISTIENIITNLIKIYGKPTDSFNKNFKDFIGYCQNPDNYDEIVHQMSGKGIKSCTIYDIVVEFCILKLFDKLESPSDAVKKILSVAGMWDGVKKSGLKLLISSQISIKKSKFKKNSFLHNYYRFYKHLITPLSIGWFCSEGTLSECSKLFINEFQEFTKDCFSQTRTNYKTVGFLSDTIMVIAKKRLSFIEKSFIEALK